MAGKPKKKLDFAAWNTDIFENEPKIDKLLDAQGWNGFAVYFWLCLKAYGSEGYYYLWSYDDGPTTARKMGCGIRSETVRATVTKCLQIGLFDKRLFEEHGVLTSRGIQKKYWKVASERNDKTVISEFWLLNDDECRGCVKCALNSHSDPSTSHSDPSTSDVQALKENKINESKSNINSSNLLDSSIGESVKNIPQQQGSLPTTTEDLFNLFEEEFGRPLTQREMQALSDWCKRYDLRMVKYALKEACLYNRRNIDYIHSVLQTWTSKRFTPENIESGEYLFFKNRNR